MAKITPSVFPSTSLFPKTHDTITARFQPVGPPRVVVLKRRMLTAIHFDDELRSGTEEIDDVVANRLLTTEAESVALLSSQARP
jgi:hypothetical protein